MDILHSVLKAVSGLTLSGLFQLLLTFVLGLIAVKYIVRLFARVLSRTTLDPSVQALVVNAGRGLLWFLLILILAPQLGIQVTSLITLLGVFGVAISLALQNSLSNVAGGISVLVSKPFSTGDFIEVTGGASGTVDSVGLFHTVIKTMDNHRVYIPNGMLSADQIVNYSVETERRLEMTFSVTYDCDAGEARDLIERTLLEDERIMREPAPYVRVWNLGASAVEILCRVWVPNSDYWEVRSAALERVKKALELAGVNIPYNQLDVHLYDIKRKGA